MILAISEHPRGSRALGVEAGRTGSTTPLAWRLMVVEWLQAWALNADGPRSQTHLHHILVL